jgi:hypothetical protein
MQTSSTARRWDFSLRYIGRGLRLTTNYSFGSTTTKSKAYLWDVSLRAYWRHSRDSFQPWDELDQVIVSVGLVAPKPDVFLETIQYLLVLTTAV